MPVNEGRTIKQDDWSTPWIATLWESCSRSRNWFCFTARQCPQLGSAVSDPVIWLVVSVSKGWESTSRSGNWFCIAAGGMTCAYYSLSTWVVVLGSIHPPAHQHGSNWGAYFSSDWLKWLKVVRFPNACPAVLRGVKPVYLNKSQLCDSARVKWDLSVVRFLGVNQFNNHIKVSETALLKVWRAMLLWWQLTVGWCAVACQ